MTLSAKCASKVANGKLTPTHASTGDQRFLNMHDHRQFGDYRGSRWNPGKNWRAWGALIALVLGPFAFLWRGFAKQDLQIQIHTVRIDVRYGGSNKVRWFGGVVRKGEKPRRITLLHPLILASSHNFTSHDGAVHTSYSRYMEFGRTMIISMHNVIHEDGTKDGEVRVRLFTPWLPHQFEHRNSLGSVETVLGPFSVEVSRCNRALVVGRAE